MNRSAQNFSPLLPTNISDFTNAVTESQAFYHNVKKTNDF